MTAHVRTSRGISKKDRRLGDIPKWAIAKRDLSLEPATAGASRASIAVPLQTIVGPNGDCLLLFGPLSPELVRGGQQRVRLRQRGHGGHYFGIGLKSVFRRFVHV